MRDKYLCQKCGMRFRHEIRMYDPNALYLDTQSPYLLIKTQSGTPVGCFYCFPIRRITKGFLYLSNDGSASDTQSPITEHVSSSKPGVRAWSESKIAPD